MSAPILASFSSIVGNIALSVDPEVSSLDSFPHRVRELASFIAEDSRSHIARVRESFSSISDLSDKNVVLITTGSDSKQENAAHKLSPVEVIVLSRSEIDERGKADLKGSVIAASQEREFLVDDRFSWHSLDQVGGFNRCLGSFIPSRTIHTKVLFSSDETLFDDFLRLAIREIRTLTSKEYRKFKKKFLDTAKKELLQVLQSASTEAMDLSTGRITYRKGTYTKGPKYSIIRTIQYYLDLKISTYLRTYDGDVDELVSFVKQIPATTTECIQFLSERGILDLDAERLEILKEAYTYANVYFNFAQCFVEIKDEDCSFTVTNPQILSNHCRSVLDIISD